MPDWSSASLKAFHTLEWEPALAKDAQLKALQSWQQVVNFQMVKPLQQVKSMQVLQLSTCVILLSKKST
jgi:hypothetical protein